MFARQASLGKNEMVTMLDLDPVLTVFPLLLSFNFCVSTPLITPQVCLLTELRVVGSYIGLCTYLNYYITYQNDYK